MSTQLLDFTRLTREGKNEDLGKTGSLYECKGYMLFSRVSGMEECGNPSAIFDEEVNKPVVYITLKGGGCIYVTDSLDELFKKWNNYLNSASLSLLKLTAS